MWVVCDDDCDNNKMYNDKGSENVVKDTTKKDNENTRVVVLIVLNFTFRSLRLFQSKVSVILLQKV